MRSTALQMSAARSINRCSAAATSPCNTDNMEHVSTLSTEEGGKLPAHTLAPAYQSFFCAI